MKFYGKAEDTAEKILEKFQSGNLPEAIAPIFIHRHDELPSRKWSFTNQLLMFFRTEDARGFRQWEEAGRKVKKGSKSFHILAPLFRKIKDTDESGKEIERKYMYGVKSIPVFRIEDTEIFDAELWQIKSTIDQEAENWLQALPLREVAESWGLNILSYNGKGRNYAGYYKHETAIGLGVENLSTWAHELCHAADDQNGKLTKKFGQQPDNEIVAELGGAVLLQCLGLEAESDTGGAWKYIKHYSENDKSKALSLAMSLIKRTCEAVALILDTAEELQASAMTAVA